MGSSLYNFSKNKIWYHGTLSLFKHSFNTIKIPTKSRPLDFGSGFYLTENKQQAIRWAKRITRQYNKVRKINKPQAFPMLITFTIDFKNINDFKTNDFGNRMSSSLLNFLIDNRLANSANNDFDLVYGLVADGVHLLDTLRAYQLKIISLDMAKKTIVYKYAQTQLCIRNSKFTKEYVSILGKDILTL